MATRRQTKNAAPVAAPEQTKEFDALLNSGMNALAPDKDTAAEEAALFQAQKAEEVVSAPPAPPTPAPSPSPTPKKRRAGDRVLSYPAGPLSSKGISEVDWVFPKRDGFVTAMAKLMAFRPGLTNAEISAIIHRVEPGAPSREGSTSVYYTWDQPRAGFGVERKDGGHHILMPVGHDIEELKAHPSKKLDSLLEVAATKDKNPIAIEVIGLIEAYNAAIS